MVQRLSFHPVYGSEFWTTYAAQERRLNVFHMRSLRKLPGIPNTVVPLDIDNQLYSRCFVKADCAGWDMSYE